MKRFKQYQQHLLEGLNQVKKQFSKKLEDWEVQQLHDILSYHFKKDKKIVNKYLEWFVSFYIENQKDYNYNQAGTLQPIFDMIVEFEYLIKKKATKGMLPFKKKLKDLKTWIYNISDVFYSKKKLSVRNVPSADYEVVYHDHGFEVFSCDTHDAVVSIGAPGDWCIRRNIEDWNSLCHDGYCFYVIVDHHRFQKNPTLGITEDNYDVYRKVCAQVNENEDVVLWDMDDNQYKNVDKIIKDELHYPSDLMDTLEHFNPQYDDEDGQAEEARIEELRSLQEDYDKLVKEMKEWEVEKKEGEENIDNAMEEEIDNEIEKSQKQYEEHETVRDEIQEKLDSQNEQLDKYNDTVASLQDNIKDLEQQAWSEDEMEHMLYQQLGNAEEKVDEIETEIEESEEHIQQREDLMYDIETDIEEWNTKKYNLREYYESKGYNFDDDSNPNWQPNASGNLEIWWEDHGNTSEAIQSAIEEYYRHDNATPFWELSQPEEFI